MVNKLKTAWLFICAVVMTVILFIPIMLAAVLSRTGNLAFTLSKIWARAMLLAAGVSVEIAGRERIRKGESYIIMSNHQSLYDILALVTSLRVQFRWVIKKELLRVPLFGYALYASRNIFIDRSNSEKARASLRRGVGRLPKGVSVLIFPEGTRSVDGRLGDFKKGGFILAVDREFPILPVTVNGSRKILAARSVVFSPGKITVTVGEPVSSRGLGGEAVPALVEKVKSVIGGNLILE